MRDVCNCAGAESPLWAAAVRGDREVVEYLLDAGADPNTPAFAGATPLHVAMQRGHHDLVPRLLEAGADPDRVDDHGRTPADWLALHRPAPLATSQPSEFVPTGIRAVDLFAPLHRGSAQHWPPAVGLGQTVLLFAIVRTRSRPAEFWLLGFEHGPVQPGGRRAGDARDGSRVHRAARARRCRCAGAARGLRQHARGVRPVTCTEAGCTPRRSGARARRAARARRSWRAIRTCSPRSSSSPSTGPIRTSRRNHPKASTRRSPSTGSGRSVRCGPRSNRRARGAVGTRASGTSGSRPPCAIALADVSFEGDAPVPPLARGTSRSRSRSRSPSPPGPASAPRTTRMLDEVEALVSGA